MMNTYGPKTLRGAKKHRVDPTGRIMEVDRHRSILSEVDSMLHHTSRCIHDLNAPYDQFRSRDQTVDRPYLTAPNQ